MINFFRKIRQNLLSEGKTGKYFKYAVGEIVLVVIGILIALSINNWNENKKLEDLRQNYYQQLIKDLNKDIELSNTLITRFEADRKAYNNYIQNYENSDLKPSQLYSDLMKLNVASGIIDFNSNTLESLKNSGEMILFSLELRNKLTDLLKLQDNILKYAEMNDTGKNSILQILGPTRGASTFIKKLENQPGLYSYLNIEKNIPQIILGLDAAHKWKDISETQSIKYLTKMKNDISIIIELIKSEIKK